MCMSAENQIFRFLVSLSYSTASGVSILSFGCSRAPHYRDDSQNSTCTTRPVWKPGQRGKDIPQHLHSICISHPIIPEKNKTSTARGPKLCPIRGIRIRKHERCLFRVQIPSSRQCIPRYMLLAPLPCVSQAPHAMRARTGRHAYSRSLSCRCLFRVLPKKNPIC